MIQSGDSSNADVTQHVYLLGRPTILEFLQHVKTRAADRSQIDEGALAAEWGAAQDRLKEREVTEAGVADHPSLIPLPDSISEAASAVMDDPAVRKACRLLPRRWHLVDLDRLVVFQRGIDLGFVDTIKSAIPEKPTDLQIFRIAAGQTLPPPVLSVMRQSENVYSVSSPSADLRLLDTIDIDPDRVEGYCASGRAVSLIGVVLGFGLNFISALYVQNRLILFNGTHRAFALRSLGIKRVPCLVTEVSREEELDLIGAADIRQSAHLYLRSPRPPLFKDYFDEGLRTIIAARRSQRVLHIQINTQQSRAPAL